MFLGGGSYTFPRFVDAKYGGRIVVAEIDPAVTKVAREKLGLDSVEPNRGSQRPTRGSCCARCRRTERFDFVFGDTFNDFEVPYHLTTVEFNDLIARHLKPDGLYLMNVIDSVHFDYLRSELRTLRKTFPYVGVIDTGGNWPPQPRAIARPTFSSPASGRRASRCRSSRRTTSRASSTSGRSEVLTDDHAPVDQLLAPTFKQALENR